MQQLQIPTPTQLKALCERFEGKSAQDLRNDYSKLINLEILREWYGETKKQAVGGEWQDRPFENAQSQKFIADFCFWFCDKYAQKFHEIKRFARSQEIQLVNFCHNVTSLESSFVGHFADFGQKCEFSLDKDIYRISYFEFPFSVIRPFGDPAHEKANIKTVEFFTSFFTPTNAEMQ